MRGEGLPRWCAGSLAVRKEQQDAQHTPKAAAGSVKKAANAMHGRLCQYAYEAGRETAPTDAHETLVDIANRDAKE